MSGSRRGFWRGGRFVIVSGSRRGFWRGCRFVIVSGSRQGFWRGCRFVIVSGSRAGAEPVVVLYVSISVLNWIRAATGSQCKETREV